MKTVNIFKGTFRGKEIKGEFKLINKWFPTEVNPAEQHLGNGKVIIERDGKQIGVWVFHGDYEIYGEETTAVVKETHEEMVARIKKRFATMDLISDGIISGSIRSLIISGAAGIGKTYTLDKKLQKAHDAELINYVSVNGKISPIGLYCKLFETSSSNSVLLLDDIDVFSNEDTLNLLKGALDTGEKRKVCWVTSSSYLEDNEIPNEFEYEGTVVFITNTDIDREIERQTKIAPHLMALVSRSVYLDLGVHSNEEIMTRVEDVIKNTDMLQRQGLSNEEVEEVLNWMKENVSRLRNVSLRTALYLASFVNTSRGSWKDIAEVTQLR